MPAPPRFHKAKKVQMVFGPHRFIDLSPFVIFDLAIKYSNQLTRQHGNGTQHFRSDLVNLLFSSTY